MSYSLAIDRMMNEARDNLPGALDAAIQRALFTTVDEFMRKTKIWKGLVPFTTTVNVQDYDLAADEGKIDALIGVCNVDNLQVASTDDNWWVTATLSGSPVSAIMPVPGTLLLKNPPSQIDDLQAVVSLTVDEPTTKDGFPFVPDWICDKHAATDWLDGVLGRMMAQPAKPYTNQQLAVYHLRRWRNAMAAATAMALHANLRGGQSWAFPQNFAVRHRR